MKKRSTKDATDNGLSEKKLFPNGMLQVMVTVMKDRAKRMIDIPFLLTELTMIEKMGARITSAIYFVTNQYSLDQIGKKLLIISFPETWMKREDTKANKTE